MTGFKILLKFLQILCVQIMNPKWLKYPTMKVLSQSAHETGYWLSDIFKENKNLFGMKENSRDLDKGVNRGHAVYSSEKDSIKDYFLRQDQFGIKQDMKISGNNYFVETQESGYAEDPIYVSKWTSVHQNVKKKMLAMWGLIALVFAVSPVTIALLFKDQKWTGTRKKGNR